MTHASSSSSTAVVAVAGGGGPSPFALLSDDVVLNVLAKLEPDPRDWARLACVSPRLAALVRDVCCRSRCARALPHAVSDLLPHPQTPGGWAALHKLSVCCPGLASAGVLLDASDFGLEREIGPSFSVPSPSLSTPRNPATIPDADPISADPPNPPPVSADPCWSLFDDLYFDAVYNSSESQAPAFPPPEGYSGEDTIRVGGESSRKRKRRWVGPVGAHLASGSWTLSREQGNRLLASRFRGDCLYVSEWPGCVHAEEKRNYMLFRGVFKNFRGSRVWRTISDSNRRKIGLDCAFCACKGTWDLHSAFCLKRIFTFHDDGEPVVRAYVCENGHVSGAWTERPLYA